MFEKYFLLVALAIAVVAMLFGSKDNNASSNWSKADEEDDVGHRHASLFDASTDDDDSYSSPMSDNSLHHDDIFTDPVYSFLSGNIYHHDDFGMGCTDSSSCFDDHHHFHHSD